jgi:membrane protein YdbS with pleckstrin-like domain
VAYPEKVLADDEQIVEHLHPHWITLVPAVFWFLVICAGGGVLIALIPGSGTGHEVLLIAIIVIGLALMSWLCVRPVVTWSSSHYVFTTHRVLIRRGVLRHEGRDISLQRISDVGFSRTLWDRLVGAGTLTIESAGEHGQETLTNVPHSDLAQQTLNRLIEQDHDRRAYEAAHGPNPNPPGYQQPPPGYQPPPPGYQPPPPGYQQQPPPAGYQPPPAGYQQSPPPGYQQPPPGYQQYPPTSPYPPQ